MTDIGPQKPTRPSTREELILRGLVQGGALALLGLVIWISKDHMAGLTDIVKQCVTITGGGG